MNHWKHLFTDKKILLSFLFTFLFQPLSYPLFFLFFGYKYFQIKFDKDSFWNKQPIHSNKYGIISSPDTLNFNPILEDDEQWSDANDISDIIDFLKINYQRDMIISEKYILWLINNKNCHIISIKKNNKIIGTIGVSWINLKIGESLEYGFYVDLLCVNPKYRKSGYAVKLIQKILQLWKNKRGTLNVFKLDSVTISPEPDFKFYYYLLDKTKIASDTLSNNTINNKLIPVTGENIEIAYKYYRTQISKYMIHEIYDLEKFQKWILGDISITRTYLYYNNTNLIGFIHFMKNQYLIDNKTEEVIDIIYLFGNQKEILKHLFNWKYKYFIITDIQDHQQIINEYQLEKLYESRYYLYNFELLDKYTKNQIGLVNF